MRVWLFACVIAVLVAGVAAAVVVLSGGEGEEPVEREAGSVAAEVVEAEETPQAAEPEVATPPEPVTLRYDRLDITGAAIAPGSYAFLEVAGATSSAIDYFDYGYSGTVELRIHPTDADGVSRTAVYDTVKVGDSFDYRTNGLNCGFRFKVASVAVTTSSRTFGIEYVRGYGGRCEGVAADPGGVRDVHFVWGVSPGITGPDGVRRLLSGEPAGAGTYRLAQGVPYVIDVPVGSVVIPRGPIEHEPDPDYPDRPDRTVTLKDARTGSKIHIDVDTGKEARRYTTAPQADALFDQIMASIRRVDGVGAGGARAPVATPLEPVTLRYDRLDITGAATTPGSYAFLKTVGDATSAIGNFGYSARGSVELRIHPADASGASRAGFYDTVQVGDSFDYQTNRLACGFRFKVTSIGAAATPRTFGIAYVGGYGGRCSIWLDDPTVAKDVRFVWKVPAGIPGPGGVRRILYGEPAGEGTYRFDETVPCLIDVAAGSVIFYGGIAEHGPDPAGSDAAVATLVIQDAEMSSWLHIDPDTCEEEFRGTSSPEADALFDQIMASIRRTGGPSTPPEPVTLRYNLLDITGAATAPGSYAFLEVAGATSSAIDYFDYGYSGVVELRIHPIDADGISRAAFYDTVRVNDTVDYRTWWPNGLNCASRFKVTSVGATASPRTFGIEHVPSGDLLCGNFTPPGGATGVHFVWRPPAGIPGPDGVRRLLYGEPAGEGTYRLARGMPYVIDIPAGAVIVFLGLIEHEPEAGRTDAPDSTVVLKDAGTGSILHIDPEIGREAKRVIKSPDAAALFDQIMASIRTR